MSPGPKPAGAAMSANASTLLPVVVVAVVPSHGSCGPLNASCTTRLYGPGPGTRPSGTPGGCGGRRAAGRAPSPRPAVAGGRGARGARPAGGAAGSDAG